MSEQKFPEFFWDDPEPEPLVAWAFSWGEPATSIPLGIPWKTCALTEMGISEETQEALFALLFTKYDFKKVPNGNST